MYRKPTPGDLCRFKNKTLLYDSITNNGQPQRSFRWTELNEVVIILSELIGHFENREPKNWCYYVLTNKCELAYVWFNEVTYIK